MLSRKLHSDAFEYLRSNKQLGYIVSGSILKAENILGFSINIQGVVQNVEQY